MYHSAGIHIKSQVASLLHTDATSIHLTFMDSQMQAGGCDYGIFTIANACAWRRSRKLSYDQQKRRRHFYQCLQERKIEPFLVMRNRRALSKEGIFPHEKWGECTKCFKCYHTIECLKFSKAVLQGNWLCLYYKTL